MLSFPMIKASLLSFVISATLMFGLSFLHWHWANSTPLNEFLFYYALAGFLIGGSMFTSYFAGQDVDRYFKMDFPFWPQPKNSPIAGRSMMIMGGPMMLAAAAIWLGLYQFGL